MQEDQSHTLTLQFETLKNNYKQTFNQRQKQYLFTAWGRVLLFLITLALCVYWANERNTLLLWSTLAIGLPLFILLIQWHGKIRFQRNLQKQLLQINEDELKRYTHDFSSIIDNGETYQNRIHPYTYDLDIFGKKSLFSLINRGGTANGKHTLAQWLIQAGTKENILQRQEAIKELTPEIRWRQQLQAYGQLAQDTLEQQQGINDWLNNPVKFKDKAFYHLIIWFLPALLLMASFSWFMDWVPYQIPITCFIINFAFLALHAKHITEEVEQAATYLKMMQAQALVLQHIEKTSFKSQYLESLRSQLFEGKQPASHIIKQLSHILNNLEARLNMVFTGTINVAVLFDIRHMIKLEKWKVSHRAQLQQWFLVSGELEAISSLSAFAYLHPSYVFPEIVENDTMTYKTTAIGHPLILSSKRICNDFSLEENGFTALVTGSNMAGKSTFLRTLGINAVLAFAGAPVCASAMQISIFQLFSSMRIEDSLEENISSFYAELKRLEQLIQLLKKREDVFYLLDELLRGTNSDDRHKGVMALIRQLGQTKASGLISTHDLTLAQLQETYPKQVKNYSFESRIEDDELIFDYTLREGTCRSFSASMLMKKIGIAVSSEQ
ncbi:MutS-related protein [Algivirga pacifica]|uniref:MutS family DNA mismatch repair protein n=1 Tax=Algivirga pacifica TaxID=1162670 RepID=A0ABP9DKL6_9BACT